MVRDIAGRQRCPALLRVQHPAPHPGFIVPPELDIQGMLPINVPVKVWWVVEEHVRPAAAAVRRRAAAAEATIARAMRAEYVMIIWTIISLSISLSLSLVSLFLLFPFLSLFLSLPCLSFPGRMRSTDCEKALRRRAARAESLAGCQTCSH